MCLIVDTNCLASVFNRRDREHGEFCHILRWIEAGDGKLVIGGTRFRKELGLMPRYLALLIELGKKRQVLNVADANVDLEEARICALCSDPDFDDQHVVALVCASRCRLVCTKDQRSIRYLKNTDFYPRGVQRPKIYCGGSNVSLLRNRELTAGCCP